MFGSFAATHLVVWAVTGEFIAGLLAAGLAGLVLGLVSLVASLRRRRP
jgi:putative effector of murein hydrolase LrgA (UPF0299 family)